MFKKLFVLALFMVASTASANLIKFNTNSGFFSIKDDGMYVQSYMLGTKEVGSSEWMGVDVVQLGESAGSDYFLLSAGTGGSACAEVLSVVKVTDGDVSFSPALNACGGVVNVDFDNGITRITVLERDEATETKYMINGSIAYENGSHIKDGNKFVSKQR